MGHSTSSGRASSFSEAVDRELTDALRKGDDARVLEIQNSVERNGRLVGPAERRMENVINRAQFRNLYFGEWRLQTADFGGGQILNETNSVRNRGGGRLYSARTWDADNDLLEERAQYFNSLDEARTYVKQRLKEEWRRRNS